MWFPLIFWHLSIGILLAPAQAPSSPAVVGKSDYGKLVSEGNALMKTNRLAEAEGLAAKAIGLDNKRYEAYLLRALVKAKEDKLDEAKEALGKALERVPSEKKQKLVDLQRTFDDQANAARLNTPDAGSPAGVRSKIAVLTLKQIWADASEAKDASQRAKFLIEFLQRSAPLVAEYPTLTNIWLLRADAALQLDKSKEAWEAGRKLLALHADQSDNEETVKLLVKLDRKGLLGEKEPKAALNAASGWENSLGMKFVPVPGTTVSFCIWHTRVQDFEAFVSATGYDATAGMFSFGTDGWKQRGQTWRNPGFQQGPNRPICGVSWEDAKAFCQWITQKEQASGILEKSQFYRLPTDAEWSAAAGLAGEIGGTPEDKSGKISGIYPWGNQWPPPAGVGNYAGVEFRIGSEPEGLPVIDGYNDGYARTSPVGSFKANQYGLYDMGGNLWQWCEDRYRSEQKSRVLRGASWYDNNPDNLLSSNRNNNDPDNRNDNIGFRVVLVGESARRCSKKWRDVSRAKRLASRSQEAT